MSKLQKVDKFLDLSDYGRHVAKLLVAAIKHLPITPIHITLLFGVCGLISIAMMLSHHYLLASIFLILKSILDAADGELSRAKNTPSYVGRYLDSIFDVLLNAMILLAIMYITHTQFWLAVLSFICMQLQGTLYNYYYVILRNKLAGGDTTSQVFEDKEPIAFTGESQQAVHIAYLIFNIFYRVFDKTIYFLDKSAYQAKRMPNWFMTVVSLYGLGFQLLIIAVLLPLGFIHVVIPFFVVYTILMFFIIAVRKFIL